MPTLQELDNEFSAFSQQTLDTLAEHSVRVDAAQAGANAAQVSANTALTSILQTGLDASIYTDEEIERIRLALVTQLNAVTGSMNQVIADEVQAQVLTYDATLRASLNAAIWDVNTIASAVSGDYSNFTGVTNQLLNTDLPNLVNMINGVATTQIDLQNEVAVKLGELGYASVAGGIDAAIQLAVELVQPLGHKVLTAPAALWTTTSSSPLLSVKLPPVATDFYTDDASFGNVYQFPQGEQTVGPAAPLPYDNTRVYRMLIRFRVVSDGTSGGVDIAVGAQAWTPSSNHESPAVRYTVADGDRQLYVYLTGSADMLPRLADKVAVDVTDGLTATQIFPYVRQNAGGVTDGLVWLHMFEILDVTDAFEARAAALDEIDSEGPETPTGLDVTSSIVDGVNAEMAITWDLPASEGVAFYELAITQQGGNEVIIPVTSNYYRTAAISGETYTVRLQAKDRFSNASSYTESVTHTVQTDGVAPETPTGLTATGGFDIIWLEWNANTEADLNHYEIHTSAENVLPASSEEDVAVSTANTFVYSGLSSETGRFIYVRAVDIAGNKSAWSAGVYAETTFVSETSIAPQVLQNIDDVSAAAAAVRDDHDALVVGFVGTLNEAFADVSAEVTSVQAAVDQDLSSLQSSVGVSLDRVTADISDLQSATSASLGALDTELATINADLTSFLGDLTDVQADITTIYDSASGQVKSAALSGYYTKSEADSATAADISTLEASILTPQGQVRSTLLTGYYTSADTDAALSATVSSLEADINENFVAITDEAIARASGDTAEANARQSLATQLRGSYSGTDISNVQTGLIHSERQARITFDSNLQTQINTIVAASSGDFQDLFAAVEEESTARISADSALAGNFSNLTARLDNVLDANGNPTNKTVEATLSDDRLARASADDALSGQITSLQATVTENSNTVTAAITAATTASADADAALASDIFNLDASLGSISASLSADYYTKAETDQAVSSAVTTLEANLGDVAATVTSEALARTNADAALAADVSSLEATVIQNNDALSATIQNTATVSANANAVLASDVATLDANLSNASAAIESEAVVRANEDNALASDITSLSSQIDGVSATLSSNYYTSAQTDTAITVAATSLQSSIGNVEATVNQQGNTLATLEGAASAGYLIKAQAGGAVSLLDLVAADDGVSPPTSVARIAADDILLDGSVRANKLSTDELITLSAQIKNAIITDAKIASLSAAKLVAGTALTSSLTVNETALSTIQTRANDPAARINAASTEIDPGKIKISGSTTLADWRTGGDETKINGGAISANTIAANKLTIGARNLSLEEIVFEYNSPANDQVSWSTGSISYENDLGTAVSQTIAAGSATWTAGTLYIYWDKDTSVLGSTSVIATAYAYNRVILATYKGSSRLQANFGRTVIDGDSIKTGSIGVGQITVDSLSSINTNIGVATAGIIQSEDEKFKIDLNAKTITITV